MGYEVPTRFPGVERNGRCLGVGSELDRRLDGQTSRLTARVFGLGTMPYSGQNCPRS